MLFRTHLAFSLFIALFFFALDISKSSLLFTFSILFGSLLPDIDSPKSFLGRIIDPFSSLISLVFGHRKLFHSIWPPLTLAVVLFYLNPYIALGLAIGYLSHLVLDLLNEQGIKPFYPVNFHLSGPFRTGGIFEIIIFVALLAFDSLLILRIS